MAASRVDDNRRSGSERRSGLDRRGQSNQRQAGPGGYNRRSGDERRKWNRRGSSFGTSKGMEKALGYGPSRGDKGPNYG